MMDIGKAIIIAAAIFSVAYGATNLHEGRPVSGNYGRVFVVNKITGSVKWCSPQACTKPQIVEEEE